MPLTAFYRPKIYRRKHYQNANVHENCYCRKCDINFDDEDDLDEVGYSTQQPGVDLLLIDSISKIPKNIHIAVAVKRSLTMTVS